MDNSSAFENQENDAQDGPARNENQVDETKVNEDISTKVHLGSPEVDAAGLLSNTKRSVNYKALREAYLSKKKMSEELQSEDAVESAPFFSEISAVNIGKSQSSDLSADQADAEQNDENIQVETKRNTMTLAALVVSVFWIGACVFTAFSVPGGLAAGVSIGALGGLASAVTAPLALMWMVLIYVGRGSEIDRYAQSLRHELATMIFPSDERLQHVNKDIEYMIRQASELAMSSKAVLKSIHRARQGLRTEIRDFSGVAQKTEFHIDRLAETLQDRSAKLLGLVDEIESRAARIGEKTDQGIEKWDEAARQMLGHGDKIDALFEGGADKIVEASVRAEEKTKAIEGTLENSYESLNRAVDDASLRLEALTGRFDVQADRIAGVSEKVGEQTDGLGAVIERQITNLEEMTNRAVDKMTESTMIVQEHREGLGEGANSIIRQADEISRTITTSIDRLNESSDYILSNTGDLETRLGQYSDTLRQSVHVIEKEANALEEAGSNAAAKLSDGLSIALAGSEQIGNTVRRAVEMLERVNNDAEDKAKMMMESTRHHVHDLDQVSRMNSERLGSVVETINVSREQIEKASNMADDQINRLVRAVDDQSDRINMSASSLAERIEGVRGSLEDPLNALKSAVMDVESRHEAIEATLKRRVSDLNESSEKATETAETIRNVLRGQAQDISTLSGQIAGYARTINEQMSYQKDALSDEVKQAVLDVDKLRAALESQAAYIETLSKESTENIETLNQGMKESASDLTEAAGTAITGMSHLDTSIENRISMLKEQAAFATRAVEEVTASLQDSAQEIEPIYLKAVEQASEASEKFIELKGGFEGSSESNLEKLSQIGIVFDQRLQSLKQGADEAAVILKSSSDHLRNRVDDIENAAQSAASKMDGISNDLEDQAADIHLITDQSLLKIENIQNVLNDQFHELSSSVGRAVSQINDAGNEFGKSAQTVEQAAEYIIERFDKAGTKAIRETDRLEQASRQSLDLTQVLVDKVHNESVKLVTRSQESLMDLKKSGDMFSIRAREISDQMANSLKTAQRYGEELRDQARMVADSSSEAADRISDAVVTLVGKGQDVSKLAETVSLNVEEAGKDLSEQSSRMLTVSKSAIRAAEDSANIFTKQSASLFKAAEQAGHNAEKIRKAELRTQREAFMATAKFIVESLHSLSVDFTRMIDGEVSEKTWRAFQRGDVGAFTRRLVQMGNDIPLDKIKTKFSADSEFRTYVQRYVRQFEELYDQAVSVDHGEMLTATFVSSDVGNLYRILCEASGKDPKTGFEEKRTSRSSTGNKTSGSVAGTTQAA